MHQALDNYNVQKKLTIVVLVLFVVKLVAWLFTNSVAILTDSTVPKRYWSDLKTKLIEE